MVGDKQTELIKKLEKYLGTAVQPISDYGSARVYKINGHTVYIVVNNKMAEAAFRDRPQPKYAIMGDNGDNDKERIPIVYYGGFQDFWVYWTHCISSQGKKNPVFNTSDYKKLCDSGAVTMLKVNATDEEWRDSEFLRRMKNDLGVKTMASLEKQLDDLLAAGAKQIICHGAPGTGKTYTVKHYFKEKAKADYPELEGVNNFVQFHPSYDYTDFVEGLRPIMQGDRQLFVRMDGIFKAFCRAVAKQGETDKKYYFLIDEINRADLSKVFGELMYCLEEGYRGKDNRITTQYANLPTYGPDGKKLEKDDFAEGFYIPKNVVIIGTMNDIDRSVESFDFAMQRRFAWIEVDADTEMTAKVLQEMWQKDLDELLAKLAGKIDVYASMEMTAMVLQGMLDGEPLKELADTVVDRSQNLNAKIKEKLGEEYKIGHAYYKKVPQFYVKADGDVDQALEDVFRFSIRPVLKAYLRGRRGLTIGEFEKAFLPPEQSEN